MKKTSYSPLVIAKSFIKLSQNGETHMKLQKLTYMAHGAWLIKNDFPFIDENPQVWQYGPVFETLYQELKHHKNSIIPVDFFGKEEVLDNNSMKLIQKVWDKYKSHTGPQLSDITHVTGSPWQTIAKAHNFRVPMGTEITPEIIRKYFRETEAMAI